MTTVARIGPVALCLAVIGAFATELPAQQITWKKLESSFGGASFLAVGDVGYLFAGSNKVLYRSDTSLFGFTPVVEGASDPSVLIVHPGGALVVGWKGFTNPERSTDGGLTWVTVAGPVGVFSGEHRAGCVLPGGEMLISISRAVYASADSGATFQLRGQIPASLSINELTVDSSGTIYAGTTSGVYHSTNSGSTWVLVGPGSTVGYVYGLRSLSDGVLVGASSLGIVRSSDSGSSWATVASDAPYGHLALGRSGGVYASSEGNIYSSSDTGASWQLKHSGLPVKDLAADPYGRVFAARDDGIWMSLDDGTSWQRTGAGAMMDSVLALGESGSGVWASLRNSSLMTSEDLSNWSLENAGLPAAEVLSVTGVPGATLAALAGQGVYRKVLGSSMWTAASVGITDLNVRVVAQLFGLVSMAGAESGAFRSSDGGATWSTAAGLGGYALRCFTPIVGQRAFAGSRSNGVFVSTDQGLTWSRPGDALSSVTISAMVFSDSVLFASAEDEPGIEGGVYRSSDHGSSWEKTVSGLTSTNVHALAVDMTGKLYAGTDTGVFRFLNNLWIPDTLNLQDLGVTALHVTEGQMLLAGTPSGIFRSENPVAQSPAAQFLWMDAGLYHDWFASIGCEIDGGYVSQQQWGARWPALYPRQDMKASRALWIGAQDFVDNFGIGWTHKVVHVGPRVDGQGEFFPVQLLRKRRFPAPLVTVDGNLSHDPARLNSDDIVDPNLPADLEIENTVNTAIGITMTRRILQFSQEHHDNYVITEYEFTNTGNTDFDPYIERWDPVLGIRIGFMRRNSISQEVRYVVNNSAGWGINTMNDALGVPGLDAPPYDVRGQFSWHGLHTQANMPAVGSSPNAATFDNIGAPIFNPALSAGYIPAADTLWRLGAAQFIGSTTLYTSTSPTDATNDTTQPSVTTHYGSDEPLTRNNSMTNPTTMAQEYALMSVGRGSNHDERHAWRVQPDGNFSSQTVMANIAEGAPGGFSYLDGFGPFDLEPGESLKIVIAEGAAGLSRQECVDLGLAYKTGVISTLQKNDTVLHTGRNRLLETFRRARANYESIYSIPRPPLPPEAFSVTLQTGAVQLSWVPNSGSGPAVAGYEVFRSDSLRTMPFQLVYSGDPSVTSFTDSTAKVNVPYYYYVTSVGRPEDNSLAGRTPAGALRSNPMATLTYDPVTLVTSVESTGESVPRAFSLAQNYPNPFNPSTMITFELPTEADVQLTVYDALGRRVAVLADERLAPGRYTRIFDASPWASGVYFYRLVANYFVQVNKMVLMR